MKLSGSFNPPERNPAKAKRRRDKQRILITMGDPAGIGPEVTVKALSDPLISKLAHFQVIGDFFVIDKVRKLL